MNAFVRRWGRPIAVLSHAAFLFGSMPILVARADQTAESSVEGSNAKAKPPPQPTPSTTSSNKRLDGSGAKEIARAIDAPVTGGDKTGVSSQAISVPQGTGKVQGMGESFSTQMSTGVATFTVPFSLPDARGAAQPSLSLSYSSGSGHGLAGVGWDIGWPYISRQTDRGLPGYDDRTAWHPNQDRFVFNGGQELVPICGVSGTACTGMLPGEVMPAWADGWQYFRARVEGSYLRFFWSPDHRTWRVQSKSGETMELGVPLDGTNEQSTLESDPANPAHIFRWNLARQFDSQQPSAPVNLVQYRYVRLGGAAYLTDIYDTTPTSDPTTADLSKYAHHTRLNYEVRPDATFSYRRGWRVDQTQRLIGVDVTSAPASSVGGARRLVRRYTLTYDSAYHVSLLKTVQLGGRCATTEASAPPEDTYGTAPPTSCAPLPPMAFDYQHVAPYAADGSPAVADLKGYEGFDERVHAMAQSPSYSIDESQTDLFDVNSDGLPDVLVTMPGYFNGQHGVYFNGRGGAPNTFGQDTIGVLGVLGADASTISLGNVNVQSSDIDGDGTIDLLHMPQVKTYSVYTPKMISGHWWWQGRPITTADQQDPRIDWGSDTPDITVLDANGDGLVDVVRSTGTEMQTFFALGRYPNGDGQYGSAQWAGSGASTISTLPAASCIPYAGTPAAFSDSLFKLGDMNGDGLTDIVRVYQGDIRYWPGRGNGYWGTGALNDCPGGTFGQGREVAMANGPQYSDPNGSTLRIDDVNGDGLDDLVQVRFDAVDVWLNVDGTGWTPRHTIANTPQVPSYANRVRLVDMNGSGTRDILYGDGLNYQYIDLQGGQRPWVLTHVANGLGKTTDIEYSSSTSMMLADEAAGKAWTAKAPMPIHVVSKVTERDNLELVGRPAGAYVTQYAYRDAVYDGRQREFRGFRSATAKRIGDTNSPSATTSSTFVLGECADDEPPPAGVSSRCNPDGRWMDNPREALKGLPLISETFDDNGLYLSTQHHTYTLRKLYTGLDGREVRVAFESANDSWAYDNAPFVSAPSTVTPGDVVLELTPGAPSQDPVAASSVTLRSTAGRAHMRSASTVDAFGNAVDQTAFGCVDGCAQVDDAITKHTTPALVGGKDWLWRTVESYVQGSDGVSNHTFTSYDTSGNPLVSTAQLVGTLPLDRATSASLAPISATSSADGTITVMTNAYDPVGNMIQQVAPNNRCRHVGYATDYSDVALAETVFVGAATAPCTGTPLIASADYDRGLGAVTAVHDLHGELTTVAYDGFGRLVSLSKPSPTSVGATSPVASVLIDYDLAKPAEPPPVPGGQGTPSRPYSIVHTRTLIGANDSDATYRDAYAFTDGVGRAIVTFDQADPSAGDGGDWVANGLTEYDNKGAARRTFLAWFWSGDPRTYSLPQHPTSPYSRQRYDAFGRQVQTFGLDGSVTLQSAYHALSVDKWDAADLQPGPHQGTYATARQDGHGRAVSVIERIHNGGQIEQRETVTQYQSTGKPTLITRKRGNDQVVRWLRYDSLGRMILNVEPNTSKGFVSADPGAGENPSPLPATLKAWRYAYDDNGDLVGTSDARGCGGNYIYDAGGRILVEDYAPCTSTQAPYSAPNPTTGDGAEVFYQYDSLGSRLLSTGGVSPSPDDGDAGVPDAGPTNDIATIDTCSINEKLLTGRLVAVSDRASQTVTSFDGRGRTICVARQIAKPVSPATSNDTLAARYAPNWYSQSVNYDGADRPIQATTGAKVILGAGNQSFVSTSYTKRGTVKSVGSSYGGDLVASVTHDADGLVQQIVYGDLASTTTAFSYDQRRRLSSVQTYRGLPPIWSTPPAGYTSPSPTGTAQKLLEDYDFSYDPVDNPTEIHDWRDPSEWPAGAQPVTRKMQYDDLYRVTRVDYQYPVGADAWTDPEAADNTTTSDLRRAKPSPHLTFAQRLLSQSWQYDWLGNTTASDDDAKGFYERSLGAITNGTPTAGPYQLKSASGGAAPRDGALTTAYDDAGNLAGLSVIRNANAPCAPTGASCSQRYAYEWDEVGRLAHAIRWDGAGLGAATDPTPTSVTPAADLRYTYDGTDDRVLKTATDAQGNQLHTVYVFDALELRRTTFDGTNFVDSVSTEVPYLFAHGVRLAHVYYATNSVPTLSSGQQHVLLELPDHLGSSAIVIEQATGELVERGTYQAYGAADSDYRPDRWDDFREDYRFTGKEEDVEVGIQYFGKRYYAPLLGRWVSADPATIHDRTADSNAYAYVSGAALRAIDPFGLDLVGYVYKLSWTDGKGEHSYTGSARDLQQRLEKGGHKWDAVIKDSNTRIEAVEVHATLNPNASNRGTLLSARNEALRAAEEGELRAEEAAAKAQGRKVENLYRAAADENIGTWTARHAVSLGERFIFKAGGAAAHALVPVDMFLLWRTMKESKYCSGTFFAVDEGGAFSYAPAGWRGEGVKTYHSGKFAGRQVPVYSKEEDAQIVNEMKALWGYLDGTGDWHPGLLRPKLGGCGTDLAEKPSDTKSSSVASTSPSGSTPSQGSPQ